MAPQDPALTTRELAPGDHCCHLYETEGEYRTLLTALLRQGLERGERVLCVLSEHGLEAVFADLRAEAVAVDECLARGRLRTVTIAEVFPRDRAFDPEGMITLFQRESTRALAEGDTGLLVIGDMTWALRGFPGTDRLIEFETRLDALLPDSACSAVCLYDRRRFPPAMLLKVLITHPKVVVGRAVYVNPHYTPAVDSDADRAHRLLTHRLAELTSGVSRRETETALRHSEQRYRALYTKTPAMLHSIDRASRLVDVSDHWLQSLGYERTEVIGRRVTDFLTEQSRVYAEQVALPQFMQAGVIHTIPLQFRKKSGEVMDVLLSAVAERDAEGRFLRSLTVLTDVTERKRAEEGLRESEERFRKIFEEGPLGMAVVGPDFRVVKVNTTLCRMSGYTEEELTALAFPDITHPDDIAVDVALAHRLFRGEISSYHIEKRYLRKGGQVLWVAVTASVIRDAHGNPSYGLRMIKDITEQKSAEEGLRRAHDELERRVGERTEQLRALSLHLLSVQEVERSRVAREIHDELGQALTALKLDLAWLGARSGTAPADLRAKLRGMTDLIDETVQAVRRLATELRPKILDDLGLVAALEWYVRELQARTGLRCHLTCRPSDIALDPEQATAVFRICQEALTNIVRHARATAVDIGLTQTGDTLVVEVKDNGRGIPAEAAGDPRSLGLLGMRERVLPWGGLVEIQGTPGRGTLVQVTLPLGVHEGREPRDTI